jgi:nucleoside-diphosphate-sugar epimerase
MKKKVVIFGGSGFLGSSVVDELCEALYEVTVVDIKKPKNKYDDAVKMVFVLESKSKLSSDEFENQNFGSEDLSKISHNVFIDTIKSQGAGLYNKAIDGIHFNKDHPENQNIYISDINRSKVMIYKNEKWIIDNW